MATRNPAMVSAILAMINSLDAADRCAVIAKLTPSADETPLPRIGLGRVGSSNMLRSQLVDFCKRLESCYRDSPHHAGKPPVLPFKKTESLLLEILEKHGEAMVPEYVTHMEGCFQREWAGFSKPERMREHFIAWFQKRGTPIADSLDSIP